MSQEKAPSIEEKRALLKRLLDRKSRQPRFAPTSFAQERLWILEQLSPGGSTYVEMGAARVEGHLDAELLADVLNEVVRRHDVLRTTFAERDGQRVQVIAPRLASPLAVPVFDLSTLPGDAREAELQARLLQESRRPFDLSTGPLLRVMVFRLAEAREVLVCVLHHIIADGWSMGLFVSELLALYQAFSEHRPSPLPELTFQYGDFAAWQREHLKGEPLEKHLAYWRERLAGLTPLDLPADRPRPATRAFRGSKLPVSIDARLTAGLRELSRREGVTLYMTVLAAFQTLLARYAAQHEGDVVVGSPVAGRTRRDVEALIGFFVNMLPVRTDVSGNPTFREVLSRVRTACLDAFEHEELPFEKIVDELQPVRDPSRNPIFQVVLAIHKNVWELSKAGGGYALEPIDVDNGTSKYDLTLFLWEGAKTLTGYLEYDTDLFDRDTIVRLAENLKTLLAGVVANPEARLAELPLLSDAERRQVLSGWNDTSQRFAQDECLHTRFERQAAERPDAVALTFGEEGLSYGELNRRANQLAHLLRRHGVTRDVLVPLYMDRGAEMVVAILAVLKAGGAYVPIDPAYPRERVRFMLEDAAGPAVIVSKSLIEQLPEQAGAVICPERDAEEIAGQETENPPPQATPDNLAYVIFTSGSTGQPKGVMVQHNHVARLFTATDAWFDFGQEDVWTLFHSYAFDFSVWELWGALLYGGRLVIVPYEVSRSPAEFRELVAREGVTVLNQTPSAFYQFIEADGARNSSGDLSLRYVIFGGEALDFARLRPWFERHGETRPQLVNMYGITETTVHVTYRPVTAADATSGGGSLVGRPIPDLQLYLVDEHLNPVPIGVPGEIVVGGDGVARGYLNRSELTAQRFVDDPFSDRPGARLYRSGDLARYRSDGELEYLGRIDHQVKIRGFRIELGEIETALEEDPTIRRAVVLARDDMPGEKRLVGYLVPRNGQLASHQALRDRLLDRLPDYMVPSAFVRLDSLPLTTNGKIDRRALPAPEGERPELAACYVAPSCAAEIALVEIWQQVLRVDRVGVDDNFFELGGDSILAIQVVSKANQAGLGVAAADIFQHQTVRRLAAVAEASAPPEAEQGEVAGDVPLTPIHRWFFEQELPEPHHYNQAVWLNVRRRLQLDLLKKAVARLVEHHDVLRSQFTRNEEKWQQRIAGCGEVDLSETVCEVHLSQLDEAGQDEQLAAVAAQAQASFDLTAGDLARVVLFDLGGGQQRVLFVIHHLAVDGVSWRILLEDLQLAYAQLEQHREPALPPKTTSYQAWAKQLIEFGRSETVQQQADYWRQVASQPVAAAPRDRQAGENIEASADTVQVALSEEETAALLKDVPSAYHTQVHEVLLTALVDAFAPWTGSRALLVDIEGHGREPLFDTVDVSRTVGWFTTIHPLALRLPEGDEPGEMLKSVKEQVRAVPTRGIGYGLLRYANDDEATRRSLAALPAAEVAFNHLGQFDQTLPGDALFELSSESTGPLHGPRGRRPYLIEVNSVVIGGRLEVHFTYSAAVHGEKTIAALGQRYADSLRRLITHSQTPDAGGFSPSDFPQARLNQETLDKLMQKLGK